MRQRPTRHGGGHRRPDWLGLYDRQVLADYPYLERDDVLQALRYAAWRADDREVPLSAA